MKRVGLSVLILGSLISMVLTGCGDAGDAAMAKQENPPPPADSQPVIEEPDLFKLVGAHLYVQNPTTGFNIINVSNPKQPKLLGRAPHSTGAGAEMLVRGQQALVLLKNSTTSCIGPKGMTLSGWGFNSELLIVDHAQKSHPKVLERYCIPGDLVASRTVDQVLYLVQSNAGTNESRAFSFDISNPTQVRLVQQVDLPNTGKEIQITPDAILVASRVHNSHTSVTYIQIGHTGDMVTRGTAEVEGYPQGRFHMDVAGDKFRIVTYDEVHRRSMLYILDISNPDQITILGKLKNIGNGEKLYATRFAGDMAFVVTFRQTDPLWVISLGDPAHPEIIGELHVPGWSDFIFPRGTKLITVGRGDNGGSLGLSLFDISDASQPKVVHQISLGDPSTESEANVDHRAVTILEREDKNPLIVVPHTAVSWQNGCQLVEMLRFVEVQPNQLKVRGHLKQVGTIRRTFMVSSALFSISDEEVLSVDIENLDSPAVQDRLTVGDGTTAENPNASAYCNDWNNWNNNRDYYYEDDYSGGGGYPLMWNCSMTTTGNSAPPTVMVLGLLWLGVWFVRRRR